jgi:hypothetical protein
MRQWTGWKAVFSARSAPMAAHETKDIAIEERYFLCGPCLDIISRTVSKHKISNIGMISFAKSRPTEFSLSCYICDTWTRQKAKHNHKRQTHPLVRQDVAWRLWTQEFSWKNSLVVFSRSLAPDELIGSKPPVVTKFWLRIWLERVHLSWAQWSEVNWWAVKGLLQFGRCELLLWEAGSWGTEIAREPRVRGTSAVGSRYQITTGEDTADWKVLVRAVVNCRVCELATAL